MTKYEFNLFKKGIGTKVVYAETNSFFEALSLICHDYADYQVKDFDITRETAGDDYNVCALHHEALKRGYVGVNKIIISPYEGKFGKGYTLDKNNPSSTQYCIREYWIYK